MQWLHICWKRIDQNGVIHECGLQNYEVDQAKNMWLIITQYDYQSNYSFEIIASPKNIIINPLRP